MHKYSTGGRTERIVNNVFRVCVRLYACMHVHMYVCMCVCFFFSFTYLFILFFSWGRGVLYIIPVVVY